MMRSPQRSIFCFGNSRGYTCSLLLVLLLLLGCSSSNAEEGCADHGRKEIFHILEADANGVLKENPASKRCFWASKDPAARCDMPAVKELTNGEKISKTVRHFCKATCGDCGDNTATTNDSKKGKQTDNKAAASSSASENSNAEKEKDVEEDLLTKSKTKHHSIIKIFFEIVWMAILFVAFVIGGIGAYHNNYHVVLKVYIDKVRRQLNRRVRRSSLGGGGGGKEDYDSDGDDEEKDVEVGGVGYRDDPTTAASSSNASIASASTGYRDEPPATTTDACPSVVIM